MQTLKFLGRGGAFFPEEGNTSAYLIEDNTFYLFDCGETVFATLKKDNKLLNLVQDNNIDNIEIYITHLHSDHVGSLSSLIYYCYFILKIVPKLYFKADSIMGNLLDMMLILQGHDNEYVILDKPSKNIEPISCYHVEGMVCYHYAITTKEGRKIFYSGDCSKIEEAVVRQLDRADEIYLECSTRESGVHMTLDTINSYMEKHDNQLNSKVYLMHIDSLELIDKAKELGINVVELNG